MQAVVVDAAAAAPAAAAPKRVRRLGGPKILLAYEVTPVVDARGARLRFAATLSEFSPIEVLNIARAGARAAGGAARAAPRTHTHSKASHRDLHAIDFENSTHPTLVTRDGCIIVSLRQLRAVVTGARALVLFADGADGDIKHFLDMLHADDAAAVFAAPAAPGAHEAHSSGALLLGGEVGAGAGTPSDAPGGGVSIMAAATESGAAAPPDSFEYAVLAALLRCVAEASDAELTALSRRVKGIKTGTRQGQTPTTEEMFNNVGALKEELDEFMSSLEGHVAAVDSVLEADEDLEALVLSVPRHRADAGAGGANDAEQSLEFREEVVGEHARHGPEVSRGRVRRAPATAPCATLLLKPPLNPILPTRRGRGASRVVQRERCVNHLQVARAHQEGRRRARAHHALTLRLAQQHFARADLHHDRVDGPNGVLRDRGLFWYEFGQRLLRARRLRVLRHERQRLVGIQRGRHFVRRPLALFCHLTVSLCGARYRLLRGVSSNHRVAVRGCARTNGLCARRPRDPARPRTACSPRS
jgi:hypothetical protein